MSTTLSCQPHHQAVRKSKGAGACEFTGENTSGRQALCFTGMEAPGVCESRVCVSAGGGPRSRKAVDKKRTRL